MTIKKKMSVLEIAEKQYQIDVSKPSRAKSKLAQNYRNTYTALRLKEHGLTIFNKAYKDAYRQVAQRAEEKRCKEEQKKRNPLALFARAKATMLQQGGLF